MSVMKHVKKVKSRLDLSSWMNVDESLDSIVLFFCLDLASLDSVSPDVSPRPKTKTTSQLFGCFCRDFDWN